VDLPTYTNIWRIEKRLYKLYDFRLPAPLPITWIGVFVGITVPYVLFLIAVGLPFNHNLVWLYILPPGVLTWLTTRPVIESKRLPELVSSQLRYVAEPRTWCRMAPFAEKDEIVVSARVWHQHPPKARPKKTKKAVVRVRAAASVPQLAAPVAEDMAQADVRPVPDVRPVKARRAIARPLAARQTASPPAGSPPVSLAVSPVVSPVAEPSVPPSPEQVPEQVPQQVQVPERAPARRTPKRAKAGPQTRPSWSPWPHGPEPDTASVPDAGQTPDEDQRPAWATPAPPADMTTEMPAEVSEARALEVAHDSDPGFGGPGAPPASFGPASWPSPEANLLPLVRPRPEPTPFPEAGPFPDAGPFPEADAFSEADAGHEPVVDAEPAPGREHPEGVDPLALYRSGVASARRHLSGLIPSLGRRPDRFAGPPEPPAEASAPPDPASPETPAATARPPARWILRAQPRPPAAPAKEAPAEQAPAEEAIPLEARAPQAVVPPPATEVPVPEVQEPGAPAAEAPAPDAPAPEAPAPEAEAPALPVAASVAVVERERPLPSIERALSGPGSSEVSWRRQVKVVAGGQGPGQRDQETLDRDRARTPLAGPCRIVVLGCTGAPGRP
jgi:TcpE family